MKVSDIMKREARTCFWWNDLAAAGRIMAEVECGVLPVLNELGQVMGMITTSGLTRGASTLPRRASPSDPKRHRLHPGLGLPLALRGH
jgi:CBS-domain-containing membrane protein